MSDPRETEEIITSCPSVVSTPYRFQTDRGEITRIKGDRYRLYVRFVDHHDNTGGVCKGTPQ